MMNLKASFSRRRFLSTAAMTSGAHITHLADTSLDYAHDVRALVDVIGVDHVCIGINTKLTQPASRPGGTNQAWRDQISGSTTPSSTPCSRRASSDEIAKIGGSNFLRIFGAAVR